MKRVVALVVAATGVLALAACLKKLDVPTVNVPAGDQSGPFALFVSAEKPDDCSVLYVQIDRDGAASDLLTITGQGKVPLTSSGLQITRTTTVTVSLLPGPSCWTYQPMVVSFTYHVGPPAVDMATIDMAMPDLAEPPDLSVPADLTMPPDLVVPPDLVTPPDLIDRCFNGLQDFDETDVDCGGPTCAARCQNNKHCVPTHIPSDCDTTQFLICNVNTCIGS